MVSLISGSQLAVSGPAAGLTTLVAASIISLGDYKIFLLTVVIAGLFQLILGLLKMGVIANYFPSSVIKGMLAAIGIILITKQIPIALGYDQPDFWAGGILKLFSGKDVPANLDGFRHHVTAGTLLISILSIVIFRMLQLPFAHKLKTIPEEISFPDFTKLFSNTEIWKDGITIGLLATLETLLCIEAIDKLDRRNRITPINRELVAQGIGNMTCGLLGAIPMTAVVVRGSANVDAGARTKLSAFTHGLFLLLAVLLVPFLLNKIPYASLAAILIITGYNLTKPKLYRNMWSLGWKQFLPFILTIFAILATDLLIGVSIGLLLSTYFIIRSNFKTEYKITKKTINEIETEHIKLNSDVTFLNKVSLKKALDEVAENSVLTIDGSECNFIDYDILEIISEFENKAKERHIELRLIGIEKVNVTALH